MLAQGRALHLRVGNAGADADCSRVFVDVPSLEFVHSTQGDDVIHLRAVEVDFDHQVGATLHDARAWKVA